MHIDKLVTTVNSFIETNTCFQILLTVTVKVKILGRKEKMQTKSEMVTYH